MYYIWCITCVSHSEPYKNRVSKTKVVSYVGKWHLSAQVLSWLEFQLKGDHLSFSFLKTRKSWQSPYILNSSQFSTAQINVTLSYMKVFCRVLFFNMNRYMLWNILQQIWSNWKTSNQECWQMNFQRTKKTFQIVSME